MDVEKIIKELNIDEKCALLAGKTTFGTRGLKKHGIPAIECSDGPHGLRKQLGAADHLGIAGSAPATCFPTASLMASSWDTELGEKVGEALGEEAAAQEVSVLLGPGLNMKRDPLCGRNFEYFAEDPYLAGKMAASYVRGIQSKGVSACPKHFAVNSQETRRMASNSIVDERALREIYLTAFETVVKEAAPKSIMSSYNMVDGEYANENKHLLKEILRDEWGFNGVVITDWGGSNDHALGVKYGSTLEMPAPGLGSARELKKALKSGKITEEDINARVRELLTLISDTQKAVTEKKPYDSKKHHALAKEAAAKSVVLLKNEGNILPLSDDRKVAIIGDFAKNPRYQGAGSSVVNATKVDSLLECAEQSELNLIGTAQGFERVGAHKEELCKAAVELAALADVAIVCMGLNEINETEGAERATMKFEENQLKCLEKVLEVNKNTIVVIFSGSAVEVPFADKVPAILWAGLSGQAGAGAVCDILSGHTVPSGKLSETWPMEYKDAPAVGFPSKKIGSEYRESIYIGYRYYDKAEIPVRFPFGYGLSYTSFEYSCLAVNGNTISFKVKNTGKYAGSEVCELYIHKKDSSIWRAEKELKGFAKVELAPGEQKDVTIVLDDKAFRYWDTPADSWKVEQGTYSIMIGASSKDIRLIQDIEVDGTEPSKEMQQAPKCYFTGSIKAVTDGQFDEICAHKDYRDKNGKISVNMTFSDLNHGRSPIFLIVWLILSCIVKSNEKKGKSDLNVLFIWNMPLRALAKMSNGMVDMNMVRGIVLEVKGFWIIGFLWVIVCFIANLIANAVGEHKLLS